GREVAHPEAGRHRAAAAGEELLARGADPPGAHEAGPDDRAPEREAVLEAGLHDAGAAERTGIEGGRGYTARVAGAAGDAGHRARALQLGVGQPLARHREDARPELVLSVAANRARAAGVEA